MAETLEKFVPPKELYRELDRFGVIPRCYFTALKLVASMRLHGMPVMGRHNVRPSDAYSFMLANPDWKPWTRKK